MRIKDIKIPETLSKELGLSKIEMKNLGPVVIIAGQNGSGKSRLLKIISNNDLIIHSKFSEEKKRRYANYLTTQKTTQYYRTITRLEGNNKNKTEQENKKYIEDINKLQELEVDLEMQKAELGVELLNFYDDYGKSDVFEFTPKKIEIRNSSELSKKETKDLLTTNRKHRIDDFADTSYGIIQALQDFVVSTKQEALYTQEEQELIEKYNKKYLTVCKLIKDFLGVELGRNIYSEVTIFNKPFYEAELSEGQRILIQLCVALLENEVNIKDALLVLDEPENHLHPSVLIEFIEKILSLNIEGQIWIATHSIPLIAHFDPQCLWHCEYGEVTYAGRNPEKVIDSLIGDEEKLRLTEFMNLPAQFATTKFATECLLPPAIVETDINDPQTNQIKKVISDIGKKKGSIRLLDMGAGKGRLLRLFNIEKEKVKINYELDYYAFDLPTVNKDVENACISEIKAFYDDKKPESRYFSAIENMSILNEESFDVIVLCNVLHEIDPKDWLNLFANESIIGRYLSTNGYILIVEDQEMPTGEKAYKNGFMVFGKNQLRKLFCLKERETFLSDDARGDGRLMAHLISKKLLKKIKSESIKNSIADLSNEALRKIDTIRQSQNCNFKNGMKLSFWLQQYANSNLNLRNF